METKYADSQEPASAKRGFDEIDSDTTDERAIRDVSPSRSPNILCAPPGLICHPPDSKRKKVV